MTTIFIILIILASVVLGFIVLVQNPKGGGLAGNVAGFSNQFMGVKQTTDVLERGTWIFVAIIAVLCILSVFFISGTPTSAGGVDVKSAAPSTTNPTTQPNTIPVNPNPVQPNNPQPNTPQ